jgi:hypothetical protein
LGSYRSTGLSERFGASYSFFVEVLMSKIYLLLENIHSSNITVPIENLGPQKIYYSIEEAERDLEPWYSELNNALLSEDGGLYIFKRTDDSFKFVLIGFSEHYQNIFKIKLCELMD